MKLECFFIGKTSEKYIESGIGIYVQRLKHYIPVSISIIPSVSLSAADKGTIRKKESEALLNKISPNDFVILLDEKGREMTSVQLAAFLNKSMVNGTSKIVFIVGGAFGVDDSVAKRANMLLSFSKFTLTHQMIRIFLVEQIYRAMTITRNEQYHHS